MSASEEITIVGAGPVGCVLALLLAEKGLNVRLVEKRTSLPEASMAIGITPPSLRILDQLGLGDTFRSAGVLIPAARVFEEGAEVGTLHFRRSEDRILSLPQFGTLEILRHAARKAPQITFEEGKEVGAEELATWPGWIIGCDGAKSLVRAHAGIPVKRKDYGCRFVMADFMDDENLGPEARLYFTADGAVESFPLPGGKRRWVTQRVGDAAGDLSTVIRRVRDTTGIDLSGRESGEPWPFQPERVLSRTFCRDRILLCGDAAHIISPIGGQGMNLGFADAHLLADLFPEPSPDALQSYTQMRQHAFRLASRRVAVGMWVGTRKGFGSSVFRKPLLRMFLSSATGHDMLFKTFTMRHLPK